MTLSSRARHLRQVALLPASAFLLLSAHSLYAQNPTVKPHSPVKADVKADASDHKSSPDHAAAYEEIVLAGLASGSQGQVRRAGPEVANLAANAEAVPDPDVQSKSALEHTRGRGPSGVSASIDQVFILAEAADAAAQADPG